MPDWLTHVLVGYALATALAAVRGEIERRHVTLAMTGALLPDASKLSLVVPSDAVSAALGVPFEWFALHTLPVTVVLAAAIGVLLPAEGRRLGVGLLLLGGLSHHALDLLLLQPSGYTYPVLWPLSTFQAPSADLYQSSDRAPALVAGCLALVAAFVRSHALDRPGPARETRDGGESVPSTTDDGTA